MCNRFHFENITNDIRHLVFVGFNSSLPSQDTSARLITSQVAVTATNPFEVSQIDIHRNAAEELAPDHIVEITQEGLE
jgi:hypothetical protein